MSVGSRTGTVAGVTLARSRRAGSKFVAVQPQVLVTNPRVYSLYHERSNPR